MTRRPRTVCLSRGTAPAGWALLALALFTAAVFAGRVQVKTGLPDCRVSINGGAAGSTGAAGTWRTPELTPGTYTVGVACPGYASQSRAVDVTDLDTTEEFRLTAEAPGAASPPPAPEAPPAAETTPGGEAADLLVDGNLAGVSVVVDGEPLGITRTDGTAKLAVRPGKHRVEFKAAGYTCPPQDVEVTDLSTKVRFEMRPDEAAASGGTETASASGNPTVRLLSWLIGAALAAIVGIIAWLAWSARKKALFHGRYVIRDVIGRGGMATVYRAKDRRTGRLVALKVMDPGLARDLDLLKKFLREGEVLRTLNTKHPEAPIVRVVDFGRESGRTNGRPFIAMELLQGRDALTYVQGRGRLPAEEAGSIVKQVLTALSAAHAEGVYHRDLSPDNILIADGHGRGVRLIDFGVARHEYTSAGTLDGSITGKPPYMSPEQCRGGKVDGRSDLYSLGVVFYTLLAGKPPFVAVNPLEVMKMHESEPVPPLPGDVPKGVAVIVYKMLEKEPERRYPSAETVRQALELTQGRI